MTYGSGVQVVKRTGTSTTSCDRQSTFFEESFLFCWGICPVVREEGVAQEVDVWVLVVR